MPSKMVVHTSDGCIIKKITTTSAKPAEEPKAKKEVPTKRQAKKQIKSDKE